MAARPHVIDGRTVDPKRAVPRDQSVKGEANVSTKRLFVSNIREDHTEEGLAAHFSQFGKVDKVSCLIKTLPNELQAPTLSIVRED